MSPAARLCLAAIASAATIVVTSGSALGYPDPGYIDGSTSIHDPAMVVRALNPPRYVVFGTHNTTLASPNRVDFASSGVAMAPASWWATYNSYVATNQNMWAPDVSYHDGKYWMYYAISSWGSRESEIALATSPTGDPGSFVDQGVILRSSGLTPYNAIDPNLFVDSENHWWLTFGFYWGGIFQVQLDSTTGKLLPGQPPKNLAQNTATTDDQIEGAFVYYHAPYYYLFVSEGKCCQGTNSTYSIHVGRSSTPNGTYVDSALTDMAKGGSEVVLTSHDYVIGPGGQSVVHDPADGNDLLVYHYYDARNNGAPTLGINLLGWNSSGWPYVH